MVACGGETAMERYYQVAADVQFLFAQLLDCLAGIAFQSGSADGFTNERMLSTIFETKDVTWNL